MTDPRYPIGQFQTAKEQITDDERAELLTQLAALPERLRAAVAGLNEEQLNTPYREGGWTLRQLVHHVADSHMNGYVRAKLALTEDVPTIRTYDEARWAELADTQLTPIETSLNLLTALHERWAALFRAHAGRARAHVPASGLGHGYARQATRALRLAQPPSHRACHHLARAHGLVSSKAEG
jgi:hypothetical protein